MPPDPPAPRASAPPEGVVRPRRWFRTFGAAFRLGTAGSAAVVVLTIACLVYLLVRGAAPSVAAFGAGFLASSDWDVARGWFGAGPALLGTLLTSALAVLLALPVALGVAVFGAEFVPPRGRFLFAYLVDLGAAVPSIVYGFWALEVVVPFFRTSVEPSLARSPLGPTLFHGPLLGTDLLSASVVLGIMIVPTVAAVAREALRAVPRSQREAALGLGATRWEASRLTVFGSAFPGLVAATVLGLGRAIGETIVVALLIGNVYRTPCSLLCPTTTIPSWTVLHFTESSGLERNALFELALLLLAISVAVNVGARWVLRAKPRARRPTARRRALVRAAGTPADGPLGIAAPPWWTRVEARRPGRLRRRRALQGLVIALTIAAVAIAVFPLASIADSAVRGGGAAVVRPSFYVDQLPPACGVNQSGCALGGIGPQIEGTLVLLGLSGAVGIPVGLFAGVYLAEYARRRIGSVLGVLVDSLLGVPTILLGVFVFAVFVRVDRFDAQSALAGAVALALLMVPIVARAAETALRAVPATVREGALALGFPRHRVTLRVVLGSARSGLVTGCLLAVMRAAGEVAALAMAMGVSTFWMTGLRAPAPALAPFVYETVTVFQGSSNYTTDAWGAVLVLLILIAAVSLAARLSVGRAEERGAG